MTAFTIGVVGNPNCGKTTLFNVLTGAKQRVGNWPGVTVERKTGQYTHRKHAFSLVDLPGTYSLDAGADDVSLDEQVARDYVLSGEAQLIVNIVDASNLERNLYLTTQLIEMQAPLVVALNMMDAAKEAGITINTEALSAQLGCPVVALTASKKIGVDTLQDAILAMAQQPYAPRAQVHYAQDLETAISALMPVLTPVAQTHKVDARWLAVRLVENDRQAMQLCAPVMAQAQPILAPIEAEYEEDIDIEIADARYRVASGACRQAVRQKGRVAKNISDRIDQVVLNRVLGVPIFLLVMYLMFLFTINIGGSFIDFFGGIAGAIFVDGFAHVLQTIGSPAWLTLLLAQGIGGGVQVVATFIPIIGFLYIFLSFLEDSGYMARAAFVMDRAMRFIGLPGKSFVPLIVGFGCNVPAIMATRTLEHTRDRLLTILINPFMSCGARLPVYALFAAAFFPVGGQNIVFGLYLIGIGMAVLTGYLMNHTILKGDATPFVMELPPYHLPTFGNIVLRTWDRLKAFMLRAGRVIVPMVLVLNVLNAITLDGEIDDSKIDNTLLSEIGRGIAPMFAPMGITEDNWPAAVGIFTGVLAKEAVVGTLDATYSQLAKQDAINAGIAVEEDAAFDFVAQINAAFATIPVALRQIGDALLDPIGLNIGDVSDQTTAAASQKVAVGTFGAMVSRFDGVAGAFAYLLFILLYFPCVAATAAVYRETNLSWTLFVAGWTTGVAYVCATLFYQIATYSRHPSLSLSWIMAMTTVIGVTVITLVLKGRRAAVRAVA